MIPVVLLHKHWSGLGTVYTWKSGFATYRWRSTGYPLTIGYISGVLLNRTIYDNFVVFGHETVYEK